MKDGVEIDLTNATDFSKTDYSHEKNTIFVIHGWIDSHTTLMAQIVKNAYLVATDVNVFIVDWSKVASEEYVHARNQVVTIGTTLGIMINIMFHNQLLTLDKVSLVGHSLGAHVAGIAGKALDGQFAHIIGKNRESRMSIILNLKGLSEIDYFQLHRQ